MLLVKQHVAIFKAGSYFAFENFISPCFILFAFVFRWEEEQLPEGVKWLHMEHKVTIGQLLTFYLNRGKILAVIYLT